MTLPALALSVAAFFSLGSAPQKPIEVNPRATAMGASKIAPLRVLIVGGGPDLDNNQVAIESNVRYLKRLLPIGTPRTVLFADGNPQSETVLFDQPQKLSRGRYLYGLLMEDDGPQDVLSTWRRPNLGSSLDGASHRADIDKAFAKMARDAAHSSRSVLLYFTGHGSKNDQNPDNNNYDLWGDEELSVRDLSTQIARLPQSVPVTLVMVQCFSGAFANLLFQNGDPKSALLNRDIAGFFATTRFRTAAGCTSELNEAEYHDFTSYFFAALTGRDRVGRKVTGADYNHDGRVGMNEAFCYTLANDKSIDIPVATSDLFLRRFVSLAGSSTRYSVVQAFALSGQRFALNKLADELKLTGEHRLAQAEDRWRHLSSQSATDAVAETRVVAARERFLTLRHQMRAAVFAAQPNLNSKDAALKAKALGNFQAQLEREASSEKWKPLFDAGKEWETLAIAQSDQGEQAEVEAAHLARFIVLHQSVALRMKLQASSNVALKNRFARLMRHESSTLLPPVTPSS